MYAYFDSNGWKSTKISYDRIQCIYWIKLRIASVRIKQNVKLIVLWLLLKDVKKDEYLLYVVLIDISKIILFKSIYHNLVFCIYMITKSRMLSTIIMCMLVCPYKFQNCLLKYIKAIANYKPPILLLQFL